MRVSDNDTVSRNDYRNNGWSSNVDDSQKGWDGFGVFFYFFFVMLLVNEVSDGYDGLLQQLDDVVTVLSVGGDGLPR